MMRDIRGDVALITGASRGIGRAAAVALAQSGCHVALLARSHQELEDTAAFCRSFGAKTLTIATDITDRSALADAVQQCVDTLGGLHILINNAGTYDKASAYDANIDAWERTIDVNLRAAMILTRLALPHIEPHDNGAIIFISSIAGKMGTAGGTSYCASKHGIMGFSSALFEDIRESGTKVCAICPGFVNTPLVQGRDLIQERMLQPEDIADAILFVAQFPHTGCPTEIILRPQRTPYPQAEDQSAEEDAPPEAIVSHDINDDPFVHAESHASLPADVSLSDDDLQTTMDSIDALDAVPLAMAMPPHEASDEASDASSDEHEGVELASPPTSDAPIQDVAEPIVEETASQETSATEPPTDQTDALDAASGAAPESPAPAEDEVTEVTETAAAAEAEEATAPTDATASSDATEAVEATDESLSPAPSASQDAAAAVPAQAEEAAQPIAASPSEPQDADAAGDAIEPEEPLAVSASVVETSAFLDGEAPLDDTGMTTVSVSVEVPAEMTEDGAEPETEVDAAEDEITATQAASTSEAQADEEIAVHVVIDEADEPPLEDALDPADAEDTLSIQLSVEREDSNAVTVSTVTVEESETPLPPPTTDAPEDVPFEIHGSSASIEAVDAVDVTQTQQDEPLPDEGALSVTVAVLDESQETQAAEEASPPPTPETPVADVAETSPSAAAEAPQDEDATGSTPPTVSVETSHAEAPEVSINVAVVGDDEIAIPETTAEAAATTDASHEAGNETDKEVASEESPADAGQGPAESGIESAGKREEENRAKPVTSPSDIQSSPAPVYPPPSTNPIPPPATKTQPYNIKDNLKLNDEPVAPAAGTAPAADRIADFTPNGEESPAPAVPPTPQAIPTAAAAPAASPSVPVTAAPKGPPAFAPSTPATSTESLASVSPATPPTPEPPAPAPPEPAAPPAPAAPAEAEKAPSAMSAFPSLSSPNLDAILDSLPLGGGAPGLPSLTGGADVFAPLPPLDPTVPVASAAPMAAPEPAAAVDASAEDVDVTSTSIDNAMAHDVAASAEPTDPPEEEVESTLHIARPPEDQRALIRELPTMEEDADTVFEEMVQSLEMDEFKVMEVLGTAKRMFWAPLRDTPQQVAYENIVAFLHTLDLSPIRRAILEMARTITDDLCTVYDDQLDELVESGALSAEEKGLYLISAAQKDRILGDIRSPFREFIERLEQLDTAQEAILHLLHEHISTQLGRLPPLLDPALKDKLDDAEDAEAIELVWRVLLEAMTAGLAYYQQEAQAEVEQLVAATEGFLAQFEATYTALLNRIIELWSDRLMPPLNAIINH